MMNKPIAKHYGIIGSDSVIRAYPADETEAYIAHLQQRAEAAEAKLAELEKQEPIFQVEVSGNHWLNAGPVDDSDFTGLPDGVNLLYARPAPAINLAELVPDAIDGSQVASRYPSGWNACRAAILRNIEGSK